MSRIEEHPILEFERKHKVHFSFDGKKEIGFAGETIASALYANGERIFGRSFKYHRPRGMFCAIGKCSNCLMEVNGIPNIRTCVTPVKNGLQVKSQNSWPSASHDIFSIVEKLPMDMKPGFYYKKFIRPKFIRNFSMSILRAFAGVGKFPEMEVKPSKPRKIKTEKTDLAIVGAGPAGLSAALYAAKWGIKVTLIDENQNMGGQLIKQTHKFFGSVDLGAGKRGITIARELANEVKNNKNIKPVLGATVIGIYEGNILGIMLREKFFKLHAKKIVIATGAYEKTLVFENNDLPGVFGAGGAQTLMNVHGVRPGDCGVMVGAGNVGLIVSYQLLQAGINVNAVVEAMPRIGGYVVHAAKIRRAGVPILTSHTVVKAYGNKKVEGVKIARLDEKWRVVKGTERDIPCDFVCVSVGLKPTYELLYQAGCQMRFVPELGGHVPLRDKYLETSVSGLYIAGDVSGIEEASTAMLEGRIAGLSAAITLRKGECKKIVELRKKTIKELDKIRSSPFGERIRSGLKKALIKKKG